jgi:acetyltransferase-like isoleucine patch superfamily enzyme
MPYLSEQGMHSLGLKHLGKNVRISDRSSIYEPELISIGDYSRIDDFCVVSGNVTIGRNVHFPVFCNVAGGEPGITFGDFSCLAYGVHVFAQSDDYSGHTLTNSTVPDTYKSEAKKPVHVCRHCIVGTSSVIMPGVVLAEGTAVGAMTMVTKSTEAWSIYVGIPARRVRARSRNLLLLKARYLEEESFRAHELRPSEPRTEAGGAG